MGLRQRVREAAATKELGAAALTAVSEAVRQAYPPGALGRKTDDGKDRWDLLEIGPVRAVVRVLTLGAQKYQEGNWKAVPRARDRYYAAAMRHLTAWWGGDPVDAESGESHLAHAVACCLFLLWFDQNKREGR